MPRLTDILTLRDHDAAAIVGSGGKSSLMWLLAARCRKSRILVTTTTKIRRPEPGCYQDFRDNGTLPEKGQPILRGITLAGTELPGGGGKLGALEPQILAAAAKLFDAVLIEGDGSRNLPLKGWAEYEPVVPEFVTCTIGVVTLWPVGRKADETVIHRLPLFCGISGAAEGEPVTLEHIAAALAHPSGLMKGSRGRRILFINQVEDERGERLASDLPRALEPRFLRSLSMVAAGSVRRNEGRVLWPEG